MRKSPAIPYNLSSKSLIPEGSISSSNSSHHCTAMLFLNCLSLCLDCNSSLSTVYCSRSFFCLNFRSSAALSPDAPMPALLVGNLALRSFDFPLDEGRGSSLNLPACSSHLAFSDSCRRASFSTWFEASVRRWAMLGDISSRRACWASLRVASGSSSKCLCLLDTRPIV